MKRKSLKQLVRRLAAEIRKASRKKCSAKTKNRLTAELVLLDDYYKRLVTVYETGPPPKDPSHKASAPNLHKIKLPLTRVIKTLESKENLLPVLVALRQSDLRPKTVVDLFQSLKSLLSDLHQIHRVSMQAPQKRRRGRPTYTQPLEALVDELASLWERESGKPFKQDWHNKTPLTLAARFTREAVEYVAPGQIGSLPKVIAKVVKKHRAATIQK